MTSLRIGWANYASIVLGIIGKKFLKRILHVGKNVAIT